MIRFNRKHQKRAVIVLALVLGIAAAVGLTLFALQQNINLFFTPSDFAKNEVPLGQRVRMGGLVVAGSVARGEGLEVSFRLTDNSNEVLVKYVGILPDLFREGQGIVVLGQVQNDGIFLAQEVLAKHDENYMPPEVMEALQQTQQDTP